MHDTPDAMATPHGTDGARATCRLVPGVTMAKLIVVERDYPHLAEQWQPSGRSPPKLGMTTKGVTFDPTRRSTTSRSVNGVVAAGAPAGVRSLDTDKQGLRDDPRALGHHQRPARGAGLPELEKRTGQRSRDLAETTRARASPSPTSQVQPRAGRSRPRSGRAPSTAAGATRRSRINVEHLKPWHTLTGRQHFFLDHDWMSELGENLPIFRPPLTCTGFSATPGRRDERIGARVRGRRRSRCAT